MTGGNSWSWTSSNLGDRNLGDEGPWQRETHTRGPGTIFYFFAREGGPNSRAGLEAGGGPPPSRPRIPALWLHVPERYAGPSPVSIPVLLPVRLIQRHRSSVTVSHGNGEVLGTARRYIRRRTTNREGP